ncbi:MAG: macro domain-containing protein, partial [Lachnospiraceae bacterium]|nr:macro domain-containing protein [Lachnospiraceae bacterium]
MNKNNLNRIIPVKNEVENGFQCKVAAIIGSGDRASVEKSEKKEGSFVIHTPIRSAEVSDSTDYELNQFYYRALDAASEHGIRELAFPGIIIEEGYPIEDSVMVAVVSISSWMDENPEYGPDVFIVCGNSEVLAA